MITNIRKSIKIMQATRGITQTELGERLNLTKGNFSRLLNKDDFRIKNDIVKIADTLGYDVNVQFIDRVTGKTINTNEE